MSNHQRQKGKAGEREFAKVLRELGFDARRSQQYSGEGGTADLVTSIPNTKCSHESQYTKLLATVEPGIQGNEGCPKHSVQCSSGFGNDAREKECA